MLCAKHNNDITDKPNKEQFGDNTWLCRNAIWDSQIVTELLTIPDVMQKYEARKLETDAKATEARNFFASNPTDDEIKLFLSNLKR